MQTRWQGIAFAMMIGLGIGPAGAATIDVAPGFQTLQNAIDNASPGDTLRLQAGGAYEGAVDVTKKLTIRGVGTPQATVANNCFPVTSIKVSADGVTLRNIHVYGGASSTLDIQGRNRVSMKNLTVEEHCAFCDFGINVVGGTKISLKGTTVFGGYLEAGISIAGIASRGKVKVLKNISDNGTRGIMVADSGDRSVTLVKNTLTINSTAGIFLQNANGIHVIANTVTDNASAGIEVDASSTGNLIKKNVISGSTLDVIDNGSGNCWKGNTYTTGSVGGCP